MIVKNSNDLKKEYENFLPFAENCQQLSGILAPKFREHKASLNHAKEIRKTRLEECENILKTSDKEKLRSKCQALKNESVRIKSEYLQHSKELIGK